MANGADRIFNIIRNTNTNTISEYINLKVTSIDPLTLTDEDKLILTADFCQFSDNIDVSQISEGDVFKAITLNDGQTYLIISANDSTNGVDKYVNIINNLQNQIDDLVERVEKLEEDKEDTDGTDTSN